MSNPKSPKASEPKIDYNALRASYRSWVKDAEDTKKKRITSVQARLAASGLRPGSGLWRSRMQRIESEFQQQLKEIEQTETVKIIREEEARIEAEEAQRVQDQAAEVQRVEAEGTLDATWEASGGAQAGETRVQQQVIAPLVPAADVVDTSTRQLAESGDERAIAKIAASTTTARPWYYLGGAKINTGPRAGGFR